MSDINLLTNKFRINLKHLRNYHGISQTIISEKLQISTRGYQRIESGDSIPTLDLLIKISKLFDVEFSALFNYISETDTFSQFSKDSIKGLRNGELFLKFIESIDDEDYFNSITSNSTFLNHNLAMFISNLNNTVNNNKFSEIIKRKPGIKIQVGAHWEDKKDIISIINRIYGQDEVCFRTSHSYTHSNLTTKVDICNYFKTFPNGQSLLAGYVLNK